MSSLAGRARLLCLVGIVSVLGGCATAPPQQSLQASREIFKSGDINRSILAFEDAYKGQIKKDTPYFLEKGYLTRLRGASALSESSLTLLEADKVVSDWQSQVSINLAKSGADFMNYFFSPIRSNSTYQLKDYEKSLLGYSLALNHALAGRFDLARVEARKMVDREKLIEREQDKKLEATRAKERQNSNGKGAAFSRVEEIKGYPVNLINDPRINTLRNSYQSAAAHYFAGFLFESQGDISLAAPGYRLAVELRPDVPLFKKSLAALDSQISKSSIDKTTADTLVIVETGFIPRVNSHSSTHAFPTPRGPRLVTIRLPVIEANSSHFPVRRLSIGGQEVPLFLAANLDLMARRHLKDEMPVHVLRATTQAVVQVAVQEAAYQAQQKRRNNNEFAGLATALVAGAALSFGDVDVRSWTTLPSAIEMNRIELKKGLQRLSVNTPVGVVTSEVDIQSDYELIYIRILNNGTVITKRQIEPMRAYLQPASVAESKERPSSFSVFPRAEARSADSNHEPSATTNLPASESSDNPLSDLNCRMQAGLSALSSVFGAKDKAQKVENCK